jgi:ferredoxin-type protein NapH
MLKITPYLGIIVLIVSIGGIWYPKLGYFLLLIFTTLLIISPFRGRWFCGNLCPRGSFNDFWVKKISFNKSIPSFFRSMYIRIPFFIILMGFMVFRIIQTKGIIDKIGMVFVTMCIMTTAIALILGIFISPRVWCSFCPMGTVQRYLGKNKYILNCDIKKCIKCNLCSKVCPMKLSVKKIVNHPDCIKCERCIKACPKKCLSFFLK